MPEMEVRALTAELRATTNEDGIHTLSGLIPYNSLSCDMGGWREQIAPGAFADAFGSDVLCLRQHDASILLGRTKSGTLKLTDSAEGLRYECKLPNTTQANDLFESVSRGDLDGTSFGFYCQKDSFDSDAMLRTLERVELIEVSPCSFPAYTASQVDVRSLPKSMSAEVRSKLAHRDDGDAAPNINGCECDCPECVADDCDNCSDESCIDPNCLANRSHKLSDAEVRKIQARIAVEAAA